MTVLRISIPVLELKFGYASNFSDKILDTELQSYQINASGFSGLNDKKFYKIKSKEKKSSLYLGFFPLETKMLQKLWYSIEMSALQSVCRSLHNWENLH